MAAGCRIARNIAAKLAACALAAAILSGQQARAKNKALKVELEHALVDKFVTSRILLGDRARPSRVAREGLDLDFPVHTFVDAETGSYFHPYSHSLIAAVLWGGRILPHKRYSRQGQQIRN